MKKRRKIRMPVTRKKKLLNRDGVKKTEDEFLFKRDELEGEIRRPKKKKPKDTRSHLLIFVGIK